MKNKGFTLIELLAVIVILAIIALIATPIILNIIKDSKEESNKRSVEMYANALKNAVAKYQLDGKKLEVSKLSIKEGTQGKEFENIKLKVEYDGNVECDTIEVYENGNVYLDKCEVNRGIKKYTYGKDQSYDNGQIVYFDVVNGKGCTKSDYESSFDSSVGDYLNSVTGYNGIKAEDDTSNKNSCLKFYAFLDDGSDRISLLLDHNTTSTVAWSTISINTNVKGPIDVIDKLKKDTAEWNETLILSNHTYKSKKYTVDYSGCKAQLITAQELIQITGADKEPLNFKEESSMEWYYLQNNSQDEKTGRGDVCKANGCKYAWLYDRTSGSCEKYGCLYNSNSEISGYWTSSAYAKNVSYAWRVDSQGIATYSAVNDANFFGVRPVIEVLKSNI